MLERRKWLGVGRIAGALVAVSSAAAFAQTAPVATPAPATAPAENTNSNATPVGDGTFLLTIFLKHDQSKTLPKINEQLKEQGFFKAFPPPSVQVVSWYVMMGIGQVVTLRVPADKLRDVNRAIENTAWGGYRTEFYPTYDYKAVAEQMRAQNK